MATLHHPTLTYDPKGDPGFWSELAALWELHVGKANDYGSDEDPLANFYRAGAVRGVGAVEQAEALLAVKVARLTRCWQLERDGAGLRYETLEDTLRDLAAYCLIVLALRRRTASLKEAPSVSPQNRYCYRPL